MKKDINWHKNQLKTKQAELDILHKISDTISYNWNLKQVLESIINIVSAYTKSDSCFIYLIDGDTLVLKASQNPHREKLEKIFMKKGEGITGWVAKNKRNVAISARAYEDERFKLFNILPEDKYEAFLSVPIIFKDKVVGVINVQHIRMNKYKQDMISFLEIIARSVGGAIEYARLASETDFLSQALATRKLADKAKSILMKQNGLTEADAHKFLLKKSMETRKSLKEVSEAIILSGEILK